MRPSEAQTFRLGKPAPSTSTTVPNIPNHASTSKTGGGGGTAPAPAAPALPPALGAPAPASTSATFSVEAPSCASLARRARLLGGSAFLPSGFSMLRDFLLGVQAALNESGSEAPGGVRVHFGCRGWVGDRCASGFQMPNAGPEF